ncbi:protein kinase [Luteolibacter sp. SL250]|uniref:serine/threonine-protein kinase n=1 Tax=Luteolibacter sp. SL250 TaxID=2995170 RepID=UPI00226D7D1A|nr:serine/threonine-protein kinase [Luteolibacter sp. SL250]WAC20046.1 protein kinase [Luteolibacter sp. SL250]
MSLEAEPFSAPSPEELAALFPGYAIDSLIACGGMGAVYHARQVALDREVAIKILPREFSADEAFRDGFAAEARAMAKLNHPNLIGVYDFGEVDGMLFIIMEFVPGQSLYHAAYQTRIEPKEAARLMAEICSGIAEAHRVGLLHRDIKPANVLLDAHKRPKVGDFGLARPIGTAAQEGEVIFGTPGYTAPEVVDHPSRVDARADVFSLGVMLHELLTGKLPSADPRPPSTICGCSPKFDEIVKRATQPVAALRYPDAGAMEAGLKELAAVPAYAAAARAGAHRPPSVRRPRASTTVVKSSGGGGIGWIIVLLVLGGGGWYYYTHIHQKPEPPAPVAEETTEIAIPKEERPRPQRPVESEPKMDLPGVAQEDSPSSGGSRIFDTPTAPLGSPMPERPRAEGPKPIVDPQPFLDRARDIMTKKSYDALNTRQRALRTNIDNFDREVSRAARKEGTAAVSGTAKAIKAIRENNDRIPDSFKIEDMQDMTYSTPLSDAVKAQDAADEKFHEEMKPNADIYIRGINMEIARRQQANDAGAVILLKEEIERVQADSQYFGNLIGTPKR